jgi:hypothetical protein
MHIKEEVREDLYMQAGMHECCQKKKDQSAAGHCMSKLASDLAQPSLRPPVDDAPIWLTVTTLTTTHYCCNL